MPDIVVDVAVVGCGAIGASCALHLAKRGLKVAIIDERTPAAGTSGNANGSIVSATKTPGLMMELTLASKAMFPNLIDELGIVRDYHVGGGFLLCEEREIAEAAQDHVAAVRSVGTTIDFFDGARLRAMEPALSSAIYGGFYVPDEASVNALPWTAGLAARAVALGARALWWTSPRGFDLEGRRIRAMDTGAGRVIAEHYVFSAGVWSRYLGGMVGVDIPVIPRRGELVVTARGFAFTKTKLISARYLMVKRHADAVAAADDPTVRLGYGFSLGTTAQRQTMMGSTRAFVGFDKRNTAEGVATIVREAAKRIPALVGAPALRAFAAFRPFVPDGKPILGRSGLVENLLVAAGHEGDGICLSPITGALIADLATGKTPAYDLAPLSPDRFGVAKPEILRRDPQDWYQAATGAAA